MMHLIILLFLIPVLLLLKILFDGIWYWKSRNVPYLGPMKMFQIWIGLIFNTSDPIETIGSLYEYHPNKRYTGLHQFNIPLWLIRDPELIKQVLVKEFHVFSNHRKMDTVDKIFNKNLLILQDSQWHKMRTTISPAFTSSKMRQMYEFIDETAMEFVNYLAQEGKERGMITYEMKDLYARFTTDVVASTAFGIKCNSMENTTNEFYMFGKKMTRVTGLYFIKLAMFSSIPRIMNFLKMRVYDNADTTFFCDIVKQTIKQRLKNNIIRPDMIHLLLESQAGKLKHEKPDASEVESAYAALSESEITTSNKSIINLTNEDIAAQSILFFLAGYDMTSTTLSFMSYELALNPDIQKRLQTEIDEMLMETNGKIRYNNLPDLKYLDMVLSETLRKWCPFVASDRLAMKRTVFKKVHDDEEDVIVEPNSLIFIPVFAIQRDPKYFPDPERFDPERFNDVNKSKIQPFTYLPFGGGPRGCIASRFALLEIKALFIYILSKFDIIVVKETEIPIKISKKQVTISFETGMFIGFKLREM